jgi:hypothetical protein
MIENSAPLPRGYFSSILLRQEKRSYRAVGFGNDPDLCAIREPVDREDALSISKRLFVSAAVLGVYLSPIAPLMATEKLAVLVSGNFESGNRARRCDNDANWEELLSLHASPFVRVSPEFSSQHALGRDGRREGETFQCGKKKRLEASGWRLIMRG